MSWKFRFRRSHFCRKDRRWTWTTPFCTLKKIGDFGKRVTFSHSIVAEQNDYSCALSDQQLQEDILDLCPVGLSIYHRHVKTFVRKGIGTKAELFVFL